MRATTRPRFKEGVTVSETLDSLDFSAELLPVYDHLGHEIEGHRQVFRKDIGKALDIVSDQYALVEHKDAIFPVVDRMGREGWKVKQSRVENFGARAFVELIRMDRTITAVGDEVGQRVMLRNSYDRSSSLSFSFGGIVVVCLNGATIPGAGINFSSHHNGAVNEKLDFVLQSVHKIDTVLGETMGRYYSGMDKEVPLKIGREIVQRIVGERKTEEVLPLWFNGVGRRGTPDAWSLYNGITQFLTHSFTGSWGRRERRNLASLELIRTFLESGRLPDVNKSEDN